MGVKLREEVKEKWLKALRSGEYQQARFSLRTGRSEGYAYCCLGVLTDLACKEGVVESNGKLWDNNWILPDSILEWVYGDDPRGLDTYGGLRNPLVGEYSLAEYNDGSPGEDGRGYSFEEIADLIEENL